MPDHVLGQWLCIRRQTGSVLWEDAYDRPNSVVGVSDAIIIATEYRQVGLMGGGGFDCYALDLDTGSLRWTTHPSGTCGTASSEPYWYPDRYDHRGAAAAPRVVEDGMYFCRDGRVLDAATGIEVRRLSEEDVQLRATRQPSDPDTALKFSARRDVRVARGRLSFRAPDYDRELTFHLHDADGLQSWTFDMRRQGFDRFTSFRLAGRYVYIVAAECFPSGPPPTPGDYPSLPRHYHLLTIELEHGTVCQDMRIDNTELATCRIEDVDDRGLVTSSRVAESIDESSGNVLRYFERRG
jgi:hypothetical protein